MNEYNFPKTPKPVKYIFTEANGNITGISINRSSIIFYVWDGVSNGWNQSYCYERVNDLKQEK